MPFHHVMRGFIFQRSSNETLLKTHRNLREMHRPSVCMWLLGLLQRVHAQQQASEPLFLSNLSAKSSVTISPSLMCSPASSPRPLPPSKKGG